MESDTIKKRVTRNDVALYAGVSPAVVSYVLNNSKPVSNEKRQAVKHAIKELHYRPNQQARGLKMSRSMQIGFVCDNLRNDWLEISEKILMEKGYYVSHCFSRDGEEFIQMLTSGQFDGIFMMSNRFTTAQLNEIAEAEIPMVLYRTRNYGKLDPQIVTIVPDYRDGIIQSVNFLALKGHKRIALFPPIRYKTDGLGGNDYRIVAYEEAMAANGLPTDPDLICTETDSDEVMLQNLCRMLVNLESSRKPTAVIASNDYLAARIVGYIKSLGFNVPKDVAVIGADNTYLAPMISPSLTSIDFSKEEFSRKMTGALLELIDGGTPESEYLKVSIVARESV